jgi:hypothetical protein
MGWAEAAEERFNHKGHKDFHKGHKGHIVLLKHIKNPKNIYIHCIFFASSRLRVRYFERNQLWRIIIFLSGKWYDAKCLELKTSKKLCVPCAILCVPCG